VLEGERRVFAESLAGADLVGCFTTGRAIQD